MCNRFEQAKALVQDARTRLPEIEKQYNDSLAKKSIEVTLQLGIKGIIDNLRSALNYLANELYERCKCGGGLAANVYFPIASMGGKQSDFRSLVGRNIPGLLDLRPDIVPLLESFQEFSSPNNSWLPHLATLSVENKHKTLTPQVRTETERVVAQSQSGSVSWDPGSVRFGSGVRILGVPVDPTTQLPVSSPQLAVRREIWVGFSFSTTGQHVVPFLKKAIDGVARIVEAVRNNLEGMKQV